MLKNYLKTALRSFWANKYFSLTNIAGLAIGISASLAIYLVVQYDFSFDKFEANGDRIYRVVTDYTFSGQDYHDVGVPAAMPAAVKKEITGVQLAANFRIWNNDVKVSIPGTTATPAVYKKQDHIIFANEDYFQLISYKWIAGSPATSLSQPYQVVLTETAASIYFPSLTPSEIIGKPIIFNDSIQTTITGILKDITHHTDFSFKTFVSKATIETARLKPDDGDEWGSASPASQLFLKLNNGTSATQTEAQLAKLFKKYYTPNSDVSIKHKLQPLSDMHFNEAYENFNGRTAHKPTLYGLLAIAAFLLLLACINFINLTTAQSSKRAKEIGIRKTMGSSKKQLTLQFLTETFLLAFIATALSLGITPLLLNACSAFVPDGLHFNLLQQPGIFLFLFILLLTVTLLAGFYPAIVLSSFKPVSVLKNQVTGSNRNSRNVLVRKSLTVFQFVIAQVFIIATLLVSKQIHYTLNKDLGFKKDAIVYFSTGFKDLNPAHRVLLMNKLQEIPGIEKISLSNFTPSLNARHYPGTILKYNNGQTTFEAHAEIKYADSNYIQLYKIKLLSGTNLTTTDTVKSVLINETAARSFGFTDPLQATGKYIEWEKKSFPVAGVVADFHQKSLHEAIKPVVIASRSSQELMFNIALQTSNTSGWKTTLNKIEKAFTEIYPAEDFEYNFVDESIARYYTAEQNTSRLLLQATALAIFISSLGLLGLVMYITTQRTKEIGIRKVIGASVTQLVLLLSKDFLALVMLAFIIATPIAWWGTHQWLQNFAYKTTESWWVFFGGGMIMLLVALLILSVRTIKTASANPVKSLRTD
ncbi:MAG: ABC transporter permease [Chitinophagaceae bacterium]